MMVGKIVNRNGVLYVLYETSADSKPERTFLFWRIEHRTRHTYNGWPEDGDVAKFQGNDTWSTARPDSYESSGSVRCAPGQADKVETVSVNPPKVRAGVELRWYRGRWEKLLKKGWVAA